MSNTTPRIRNILLVLIIGSLLILFAGTAAAEEIFYQENGQYFTYRVEQNQATLLSFCVPDSPDTPSTIYLPSELGGYPLKTIGPYALDDSEYKPYGGYSSEKVETIVVPEGVEVLEENALGFMLHVRNVILPSTIKTIFPSFHMCETQITVDEKNSRFQVIDGFLVDVENSVLLYTSPEAAMNELPAVRSIGSFALANYRRESLVFPDTTEYIGSYACFDTPEIRTIEIPGSVKEIADEAFYAMVVTDVILHEGIERIGAYAFCNLEIENITVPESVVWLGYDFADGCEDTLVLNPNCYNETEEEYLMRYESENE